MRRRPFLAGLLPAALAARQDAFAASASRPTSTPTPAPTPALNPPLGVTHRPLRFPADHGSHPDTHVEWWYITGWLRSGEPAAADGGTLQPPDFGFQVTFFRTRTDLAETSASRFAARQLVFAHVALTDVAAGANGGGLLHDQRVAREGFGLARTPAASGPQVVQLRDWSLERAPPSAPDDARTRLHVAVRSERFALDLDLSGTQPVLLQGEAGFSQKGPAPREASHYYSEPQLAVRGRVERPGGPARDVSGRAWLDHEWSNQYLGSEAVGWDWVGFNLADGAALMAFRLRRADGSVLWAGGSYRSAGGELGNVAAGEVRFEPQRRWTSPRTQAAYPVDWLLTTPSGRWRIAALQDDQELDSRNSTGAIYWEGLSALKTEDGHAVGWGYLELTGYAGRLRL
jgi:predicted secreted hydrolase